MGRNRKRGKRKNRLGKPRTRPNKTNQRGKDWSDLLKGRVLDVLEFMPIVGQVISAIRPDPVEQRLNDIAGSIEEIAPHLLEQFDFLNAIHGLLEPISEDVSAQTEILEEIRDLLTNFRSPGILGQFTAVTVLAEAVKDIKRLADAAEQMAGSLKGIEANLSSVNLGGDYFPGRVHSYVREMIETHASSDVPHYFTVFHQGTLWWPKFADLERSDPLGPYFLGRKSDLDELCAFLADHVRPRVGPEAVLHILMPTVGQVALKEAVKLPDAMHPCVLDGQLGEAGSPFVYICLTEQRDKSCLRNIGVLNAREIWASKWIVGACLPIVHQWLSFDCGVTWFIDPSFKVNTDVSVLVAAGGYWNCGLEPARTLGRPVEPGSRPWYT